MKAWTRQSYGSPDTLELRDVPEPPQDDEAVRVRVRAVSVNAAEWYGVKGGIVSRVAERGFRKPRNPLFGADFSGIVEEVGARFDGDLSPGDAVFGGRTGAYAELVSVKNAVARKPENVSFEEAAGAGIAATTALQAVRDHAGAQPGQKVLVNGASGGVGTFTLQIAKAYGAEVTAVVNADKVELARELGAARVVDYTREDFTRLPERFDAIIDVGGGRRFSEVARVLAPDGVVVAAGIGNVKSSATQALAQPVRMKTGAWRARRRCVFFIAKLNRADTEELARLLAAGEVRTVVERTFPWEQLPEALNTLGRGHLRGKLVVTV